MKARESSEAERERANASRGKNRGEQEKAKARAEKGRKDVKKGKHDGVPNGATSKSFAQTERAGNWRREQGKSYGERWAEKGKAQKKTGMGAPVLVRKLPCRPHLPSQAQKKACLSFVRKARHRQKQQTRSTLTCALSLVALPVFLFIPRVVSCSLSPPKRCTSLAIH